MKHLIKKRYASLLIVVLLLFGIITALTGCMNEDSTNDVYKSDIKGTYWDGYNLNNLTKEGNIKFENGKNLSI